ncbi:unnamed protein product [Rotaria magnacalcarata]|uniref:Uncharacterized protein n=4 Tax=Rotaria magnacalcarata TaxID=392030 RepID=A0A816PEC9_9BILA|nr:unnamed protein product [Rotaria magnacalcarata]
MKIGLYILLLMLLASINILGIDGRRTSGIKARLVERDSDESATDEDSHEYYDQYSDNLRIHMHDYEDQSEEDSDEVETVHELQPINDAVDDEYNPVVIFNKKTKPTTLVDKTAQTTSDGRQKAKSIKNQQTTMKVSSDKTGNSNGTVKGRKTKKPTQTIQLSNDSVHVSGHIMLVKHHSSISDSVVYKIDSTFSKNNSTLTSIRTEIPFTESSIARDSHITLYVSTSKVIDRKLAFSKFLIKVKRDHFPLSFHIHVKLPNQTHDDITLYFFVYVKNGNQQFFTFIPAGTSQIHLQGTNRLSQKLDVHVKANGTEITGVFHGRFGQKFIGSETKLQVFIIPEKSLALRRNQTFESVAQLTIKKTPSTYPVSFSLLVLNHVLNPDKNYYAIAFITENGTRRLINQEPILVFNETKLVTSKVTFYVIPASLIVHGSISRSTAGSPILQPHSSLHIRLHEVDSNSHNIIFKLYEISKLPFNFQMNISQATRFDPTKNYDISAMIIDEKNVTYMSSSKPIRLLDDYSNVNIPVDDLLYYVQVRLHTSNNEKLQYIPGSTARVFVTESPEMLIQPIVGIRIDSIPEYFREFSFQIPVAAVQHDRNYYLVMIIDMNGIITHVTKSLLISKKQPPPLIIQLPVPSLNSISGIIFDIENRPAQWSSSSYATIALLDDTARSFDGAIIQIWKIPLEKDIPIRFEIELDFSRLQSNHIYRLQAAIENERNIVEYQPAGAVLAVNPYGGIISDVRIPVRSVKRFQLIEGIIYMNGLKGPLPEKSEILLQLSSTSSLTHPTIINEIRLRVDGHNLPINFTMNVPLESININSVYYILAQYVVYGSVIIPASQSFAFLPRNEKPIVLILSKTPQISIIGQVTSTNSSLKLPSGSLLHLYITNGSNQTNFEIYSDVFLRASSNSLYDFKMNIDFDIVEKKIPLYLHADIIYDDNIIVSIPKPALLQITSGGEWNINLVVDLPTLLIGQIVSSDEKETRNADFYVHIHIVDRYTKNIVHKSQLRIGSSLPMNFRVELDNDLFVRYSALQAQAFIKNCKGQIIFDTDETVDINKGINVDMELPVVLLDRKKLNELQSTVNNNAPLHMGVWRLSVTGVVTDTSSRTVTTVGKNHAGQ